MTDYSKLDETTLRTMLDASCDLDERQQLRSVLRRLKKHSNTISYSPTNRENIIMSKNSNNLMSLTDRWERQIKSSSSPIYLNRNLPRRSTGIDKNALSSISNCNLEVKDKSTGVNRNGKTDRSVLQVIGNRNRNQVFGSSSDLKFGSSSDLNGNRSLSSDVNIYRSVENLKQTLGKTLSEPIRVDDSKLARSRLVIQQMLAPRIGATAKPGGVQETTAPITLVPQVAATANQGKAQETAPPITAHANSMVVRPCWSTIRSLSFYGRLLCL